MEKLLADTIRNLWKLEEEAREQMDQPVEAKYLREALRKVEALAKFFKCEIPLADEGIQFCEACGEAFEIWQDDYEGCQCLDCVRGCEEEKAQIAYDYEHRG